MLSKPALLSRVVLFDRIQSYKIQEILQEASYLHSMTQQSAYLMPIKGIYFNEAHQILQIYMPSLVSLHSLLHSEQRRHLSKMEKHLIASRVAKALFSLQKMMLKNSELSAHSHLSAHNIFVDMRDMHICIADYGMFALKKFCKLFNNYEMVNNWSAPEIWESNSQYGIKESQSNSLSFNDPSETFFHCQKVDIYSYGFMLWELETGKLAFENEGKASIFQLLIEQKVRPKIPPETDKSLALLIRRCWQENV